MGWTEVRLEWEWCGCGRCAGVVWVCGVGVWCGYVG